MINTIVENKEYTSVITGVTIYQPKEDVAVKLHITVFGQDTQLQVTDILYLNENYMKRVKAIYTALNIPFSMEALVEDIRKGFERLKNIPFKLLLKRNSRDYLNPYMYIAPNTSVADKWLNRGFGEKEGQIYNAYKIEAKTDAIINNHLDRLIEGNN